MKVKTSLALISLTVTANLIAAQGAHAQESQRGARFSFAPNVWKNESSRIPKDNGSLPGIQSGSVPKSSNFLGLDPQMLAKPPAPVQQPIVTERVAATPIVNTVTPSTPKGNFNPAFGHPQVASLPPVATPNANAMPQAMRAKALSPNPVSKPIISASKAGRLHSNTNVNAKLLKRPHNTMIARQATPAVANYGKNFGYMPGPYLPTTSSGGSGAQAEVRGRLLRNK